MLADGTTPEAKEQKQEKTKLGNFMKGLKREFHSALISLKGKPLREHMKTKNFYAMVLFLLAAITTIWLLLDPSPNFHTIVTETHKQISNIKNIPSNIRHTKEELLKVSSKYLEELGFLTKGLYLKANKTEIILKTDPVIVSPVTPGKYVEAESFLNTLHKYLPGRFVVFMNIDLGGKETTLLKKLCNTTKNNCEVKQFSFAEYPSHVHSLGLRSYVPICIQECLNEYGAILWSTPEEFLLTRDIANIVQRARESGLLAWTIEDTTSTITYSKMFTYFDVNPDKYYFHRAIKTSHVILFNTDKVKKEIMLPWVKCALVEECISPTGSQNTGICYQRRPRYLYSGCHNYDQSALNVILGKVFNFDERQYTTSELIFGPENPFKNMTSPFPLKESGKTR